MEIIVRAWTPEGCPYSEFLTYNLEDALTHFKAEVRLGHRATIEAIPFNR